MNLIVKKEKKNWYTLNVIYLNLCVGVMNITASNAEERKRKPQAQDTGHRTLVCESGLIYR